MTNSAFNDDFLILQENYAKTMSQEVLPYLSNRSRRTELAGLDGCALSCVSYSADQPVGTVLVLHGFTESAEKFSELIYSLLQNRFSVLSYDQRGHGRSWRKPGLKDISVTHVDHFTDYVQDLKIVCDKMLSSMPEPWFIFAHSMGGAVASLFLEQVPRVFSRAVLCAPMIAPNLKGVPYFAAAGICHAARLLGHGAHRVFFIPPYSGPEKFETSCATGRARFDWYDSVRTAEEAYRNNAPTYMWTLESMRVTRQILAPGNPEKIECPVLLYTADKDYSVLPEPQKQFVARIRNGERKFVPSSRHEIYRSDDAVLFPWWHEVLSFLKAGENG